MSNTDNTDEPEKTISKIDFGDIRIVEADKDGKGSKVVSAMKSDGSWVDIPKELQEAQEEK